MSDNITLPSAVVEQAMKALKSQYLVNTGAWRLQRDQAIEALRKALEQQQVGQEPDWKDLYRKEKRRAEMWIAKYEKDIGKLQVAVPVAAQPQVEQEPRAWLFDVDGQDEPHVSLYNPLGANNVSGITPLYSSPQPRQPLTVEQIDGIIRDLDPSWLDTPTGFEEEFCRAIERAHKIGGEA